MTIQVEKTYQDLRCVAGRPALTSTGPTSAPDCVSVTVQVLEGILPRLLGPQLPKGTSAGATSRSLTYSFTRSSTTGWRIEYTGSGSLNYSAWAGSPKTRVVAAISNGFKMAESAILKHG